MFANLMQAIQAVIASLLTQLTGTTTGTPPTSGGSPSPILPTLGGGGNLFTGVTGSPFTADSQTAPSNGGPAPLPTIRPTLPAVSPNPLPPSSPAASPPIVPNPLPFGR